MRKPSTPIVTNHATWTPYKYDDHPGCICNIPGHNLICWYLGGKGYARSFWRAWDYLTGAEYATVYRPYNKATAKLAIAQTEAQLYKE